MTLLGQMTDEHKGKTVQSIESSAGNTLCMTSRIVIYFTDGTSIVLGLDWRGSECYISQYDR
jgi:hypothetical protein